MPLRRATIASQAMMAKFWEQISTTRVVGSFGGRGRGRTPPRPARRPGRRPRRRWRRRCPTGPGPRAPPTAATTVAGVAEATTAAAGAAAGGRCSQTCHATGTEGTRQPIPAHAMVGSVPRDHARAVPRNRVRVPGVADWTRTSCGSELPLGRTGGGAVAWGDPRRGAGPRMSRRQNDLDPGVDPDAGEPEYGAPNGRPPTPPPGGVPTHVRRPAPGTTVPPASARPPSDAHRRVAARRRCAGCRGSCSRSSPPRSW